MLKKVAHKFTTVYHLGFLGNCGNKVFGLGLENEESQLHLLLLDHGQLIILSLLAFSLEEWECYKAWLVQGENNPWKLNIL